MMALDYALKAFALTHADDIYKSLAIENFYQHAISRLHCGVAVGLDWDLADKFHRRNIVLRQVSAHGLSHPRLFYEFNQTDLSGIVSVFGLRLVLGDHAWPSLQHRRRTHIALRVEQLRHADFFPQNSCYFCHLLFYSFQHPSLARAIGWGFRLGRRPTTEDQTTLFMLFPECFDLHIHSSRKIELHQRIHGLRCRIEN